MENRHKRSSSGEIFSFPSTPSPTQDSSDFEFGFSTPESPSQDPSTDSPADHLFVNGRLLPHSFPFPQRKRTLVLSPDSVIPGIATTSSKDSLMSSRSNSTNSRNSTSTSSSSARSSLSCDNNNNSRYNKHLYRATTMSSAQLYGWQHITPISPLKREGSIRRQGSKTKRSPGNDSVENVNKVYNKRVKKVKKTDDNNERSKGIWRRIFMSFLFACRVCHAMEPSIDVEK